MKMTYFVYMLLCADNTIYTGVARDVLQRLAKHRAGLGAKYTRGRGPFTLIYCEQQPCKGAALKREYEIKQFKRQQKLALLETHSNIVQTLIDQ